MIPFNIAASPPTILLCKRHKTLLCHPKLFFEQQNNKNKKPQNRNPKEDKCWKQVHTNELTIHTNGNLFTFECNLQSRCTEEVHTVEWWSLSPWYDGWYGMVYDKYSNYLLESVFCGKKKKNYKKSKLCDNCVMSSLLEWHERLIVFMC